MSWLSPGYGTSRSKCQMLKRLFSLFNIFYLNAELYSEVRMFWWTNYKADWLTKTTNQHQERLIIRSFNKQNISQITKVIFSEQQFVANIKQSYIIRKQQFQENNNSKKCRYQEVA